MKRILAGILFVVFAGHAYASNTMETKEVVFLGEAAQVQAKAAELGGVVQIYEYIRNTYEYAPYHGSRSNALATYLSGRGNDVDIASLAIAMYRSIGVPARYVEGVIKVSSDDAVAWLGVENQELAERIMRGQGILSTDIESAGYDPAYDATEDAYSIHHTWIEVLAPVENYRGLDVERAGVCSVPENGCAWIALDPSFKMRKFNDDAISISMRDVVAPEVFFSSLYNAEKSQDLEYTNKNPLEIYESKILDYLEINYPGSSLEDVIDNGEIVHDRSGLLPLSMPYHVVSITRKFSSISDRDLHISDLEHPFSKLAGISVVHSKSGAVIIDGFELLMSDIAGARVVLTFEHCVTGYCDVVLRKNGEVIHSVAFYQEGLEVFDLVQLTVVSDSASPLSEMISTTYPATHIGGIYAVASGGYASSWGLVHRAVDRLLAYHNQYPTEVAPDNTVYIDMNGNGEIDSGEELANNPEAMEAISGGFLDVAIKLYFAKFYDAHHRLEGLHKVSMPILGFVGVASTKADANYIDGSAFLVNPKGLLIDLKGLMFGGSWIRDQGGLYSNNHFRLLAHVASSLEHEVWQELTGFDAISTVRGFQWIRELDSPLVLSSTGNTSYLDRIDCYRVADVVLQLLASIIDNSTGEPYRGMPLPYSWQQIQDYYSYNYGSGPGGIPKINLLGMVGFVSNGEISPNSAVSNLPLCDGIYHNGYFTAMRESLYGNAQLFSQGGVIPPRGNYNFGEIGSGIRAPAYLAASISDGLRALYSSGIQGVEHSAITPVIANSVYGNSYSVYSSMEWQTQYPDGTPVPGAALLVSIQMGLAEGGLAPAGGGMVLIPEDFQWFEFSGGCALTDIFCGSGLLEGALDPELFGWDFSVGDTHNHFTAPSTQDPVNTVTGNMYHDESDVRIKGRGLDYVLTRTYNSKRSLGDANWEFPFSEGWTHSYNARLVESDGLKYIDERGAAYKYDLTSGAFFSGVQDKVAITLTIDASDGYVLELLGDVDADSKDDAGYIQYRYDSATSTYTEEAYFLKGNGDGTFQAPIQIGTYSSSQQGQRFLIPFGDINGDGYNDFILNLPDSPRIFLGSATGPVEALITLPAAKYAYAGDINGDGYKDLARYEASGPYKGLAIYYGNATGFDTANPQIVSLSIFRHDGYDNAVRTAMDLNGDGFDDLLVDVGTTAQSSTVVYVGSASGLVTMPATEAVFSGDMTEFSALSFVIGDVNGDSYPDVASRASSEVDAGFEIYLNSTSGFSQVASIHIEQGGTSVGGFLPMGDQNGDGVDEFAVIRSVSGEQRLSVHSGVQSAPVWELTVQEPLFLASSIYSYPVYFPGEARDILLMTDMELRAVSLQTAEVLDVSENAVCEKQVVENWLGTGGYMLPFCNGTRYIFSPLAAVNGELSARLEQIEDPYGNVLQLAYDEQGRLEQVSDNAGIPGRTGLSFSYASSGPASGKLQLVEDWAGRAWTYEYDLAGRLAAVVPPAGQASKTAYTYVGDSHLLHEIIKPEDRGGKQNTVSFEYYKNGRAYRYVNAEGDPEVVEYDIFSTSSRITHPNGGVTVHDYDSSGQLEKLIRPDGGVLRFKNTEDNKRFSKKNPLGYETAYSYRQDRSISTTVSDTNGLVTRERDAMNNHTDYDYGIYSQISRTVDKRGNERQYVYYDTTDATAGAIKGKLHKILATINGQNNVVLEEYTYFDHGGVKRKISYIDAQNTARHRITDFTYINNGLNVESVTVTGATDAAVYGSSAVTSSVTFGYDNLGRVITKTTSRRASATDSTQLALVTSYDYDEFDRLVRETDPMGNVVETVFDRNGKVHQVKFHHKHTDGSFAVHTQTTNYYDTYDRLIRTVDIESGETTYTYGPTVYDEESDLLAVTDANGNVVRHEYDAMHRRTATIDGNGRRSEFSYDQAGNLIKVSNPVGQAINYKYDPLGRQTLAISHTGKVTEQRYDANGNVTHVLDANAYADPVARNLHGASVYLEYDEFNRVTREVNAENGETLYTYDLLGNVTSLTDPENQVTTFVYDDMGMLREVIDPFIETPTDLTVTFSYDESGNRLTVTDRKGETTRFTYDILNRLVKTEYLADGREEVRIYDELGNLDSVTNGDVTYSYIYDDKHRVTSRTDSRHGLSLSWTYDAVGNIKTKTDYQGSVTSYQYDGGNRLVATSNPDYVHARYAYDGAGRLASRTLSNGARTVYRYNVDGRLETLTNHAADGQIVHQQGFAYDDVGNIKSISDGADTIIYSYDPLYRLTGADYPGTAQDLTYTYDLVGNRTSITQDATTTYYQYAAGNRLQGQYQDAVFTTPIKTYQYDANGNRTQVLGSDGITVLQSLAFNQRGFVDSASTPNGGYSFAYDPLGYRIQRSESGQNNLYMLEGEHLEAIYNGSGQIQSSYHRGSLIDEIVNGFSYANGEKTNFTVHHDHLNSVTALTDHNGQAWQQYQYDPFGNPLSTQASQVPNDFTYTGREWDGLSGLYYYRARYYDAEVGRFVSEDPLGFQAGINFYIYCSGNPVSCNDPSGLFDAEQFGEGLFNTAIGGVGVYYSVVGLMTGTVATLAPEPLTTAGGVVLVTASIAGFTLSLDEIISGTEKMAGSFYDKEIVASSFGTRLYPEHPSYAAAVDVGALGLGFLGGRVGTVDPKFFEMNVESISTAAGLIQNISGSVISIYDSLSSYGYNNEEDRRIDFNTVFPSSLPQNLMLDIYRK